MNTDASEKPGEESPEFNDRELGWMTLAMEGLEPKDAREKLGLSEGTVSKETAELELKLGSVGLTDAFEDLTEVPTPEADLAELAAEAAEAEIADEQRTWLLLRMTLSELLDLANDAESRADSLRDLLERLSLTEKAADATTELSKLHRVSETLRKTVESLFDDLRGELPAVQGEDDLPTETGS